MTKHTMHPCLFLYDLALRTYGAPALQHPKANDFVEGVCRITGLQGEGLPFDKWVSDKFMDYPTLFEGDIIRKEALFCFDEQSALLQRMTERDKPQRFRTYSHIVLRGATDDTDTDLPTWELCTKAHKRQISEWLKADRVLLISLTDTGQKHLFFKHRVGFWQLDDMHVAPNVPLFTQLHNDMQALIEIGFGQTQIETGDYNATQILKVGRSVFAPMEAKLKPYRGTDIFKFAAWLMYAIK